MRPLIDSTRILNVLRKGPPGRRMQAWAGVALILFSAVGVIVWLLWKLLILLAVFACGVFLIRRSLQHQRSSSPS